MPTTPSASPSPFPYRHPAMYNWRVSFILYNPYISGTECSSRPFTPLSPELPLYQQTFTYTAHKNHPHPSLALRNGAFVFVNVDLERLNVHPVMKQLLLKNALVGLLVLRLPATRKNHSCPLEHSERRRLLFLPLFRSYVSHPLFKPVEFFTTPFFTLSVLRSRCVEYTWRLILLHAAPSFRQGISLAFVDILALDQLRLFNNPLHIQYTTSIHTLPSHVRVSTFVLVNIDF